MLLKIMTLIAALSFPACRYLSVDKRPAEMVGGKNGHLPGPSIYSGKAFPLLIDGEGVEEAYNSSVITWHNRIVVATRIDQNKFNWSKNLDEQQTSNFGIGFLDEGLKRQGSLVMYGGSQDFPHLEIHAEDPRLFVFREQLYAIFNATEDRDLYGKRGLYIVELELSGDTLRFGRTRQINYSKAAYLEKNWTPLVDGDELYIVYQCEPLTILTTDFAQEGKLIEIVKEEVHYDFPSWTYGKISGGTPFVSTPDGEHYISFFHSWRYETIEGEKVKKYYTGTIELDNKYPFSFVRKSNEPIQLDGFPTKPHNKMQVVFPAGLYRGGSHFFVSMGLNDSSSSLFIVSYEDIEKTYQEAKKTSVIRFSNLHSQGLRNDMALIRRHTDEYFHAITADEDKETRVDVNLFLERVDKSLLDKAGENWLMVNQEFAPPAEDFKEINLVLVKTKRALDLLTRFKADHNLTFNIEYTSFTSLLPEGHGELKPIEQRQRRFWHGAQKSPYKNTWGVLEAWLHNPDLPHLNASCLNEGLAEWSCYGLLGIKWLEPKVAVAENISLFTKPIPNEDYLDYLTDSTFIVATSSTEGWGHYLMEGLGLGAIVITTDAPPMNEFISREKKNGFLVPASEDIPARTGGNSGEREYLIDQSALAGVVRTALATEDGELKSMSKNAADTFAAFKQIYTVAMRRVLTTYFMHRYLSS